MTTPPFAPVSVRDLEVMAAQLGRPMRDVVGVAARCVCGNPLVVSTKPRLADGTPFPTFYYLTHPGAAAALSELEATQVMVQFSEDLANDPQLREGYLAAHEAYLADRIGFGEVAEIDGISAGGMPTRVKCLHSLAGHALAAGPGINPLGDRALELARPRWSADVCRCADPGSSADLGSSAELGSSAALGSSAELGSSAGPGSSADPRTSADPGAGPTSR